VISDGGSDESLTEDLGGSAIGANVLDGAVMSDRYDPAAIEPKWQAHWEAQQTFRAERHAGRAKRYVLDMFPYPSGKGLHVGHPEGYTATDIVCRYLRMRGVDVLHPMGWDAFGLPAEQHAIATGTHPAATTRANIATFKRQLKMLGFSYDWSREIDTTDPAYVRFTQSIFLVLYRRGLAFQSEIPVNWCEELGTVLANEEVIDGKSERGGYPVVRLPLRQWQLRITAYADRLARDLEPLDWPETKQKQIDWIGRSEGTEIDFGLAGHEGKVRVFTTRPDTLYGCTYMVLAPEHPLVAKVTTAANEKAVRRYVEEASKKSDFDRTEMTKVKTGVDTGAFALHPLTGDKVPIWIADYVLASYGTGAVMAVPAHDERDFEFAKQYGLPIVEVISPDGKEHGQLEAAYTGEGIAIRSGPFTSARSADVKKGITDRLIELDLGARRVNYKLRDWVFSRQRYWGEPIPIYFPVEMKNPGGDPRRGDAHTIDYAKPMPVDESELPVLLPELEDFKPSGDPAGPLARAADWRFFQKDGRWYARETNTMPQWAGSCWYYLRFLDPKNDDRIFDPKAYDAWMPVDLYVGGSEHAVLHLLYARFWHKVLFDEGIVKDGEPFLKLVHQGIILGEDGQKMAKQRGNVINPDDVVREFGADRLRLFEMFMGPLEQVKPWQTSGIQGVRRFLDRVYAVGTSELGDSIDRETEKLVHKTIRKVTGDIENLRFNTAVSAMMILTRQLAEKSPIPRKGVEALVLLLSPFAPHLGEELWQRLGHPTSLAYEPWPTFDEELCRDDVVEIAVQVNGRVRGRIKLAPDAPEDEARRAAESEPNVMQHTAGKPIKKFLYVPGKIVNLLLG
jgi:leucyl-tRNA synthetase